MTATAPHPAVHKAATGIQGFDEITAGGLPRDRTTLVMGGPGTGKTVLALQALVNGAHLQNEAGIFVAFEESTVQIIANAKTFGWDLQKLSEDCLFFLEARITPDVVLAGEFDLAGMLAVLELKAKEINATRIVFDGIDVLLSLLDDPVTERRELYRIRDWLVRNRLTAIITQKVGPGDAEQRYGFLQFMVECVVVLKQMVVEGSIFRNLRVMKYRGSGFLGDEFPITLTTDGLQVTNRGPTELRYTVTEERVSSGLPRLDVMLHGGYYAGSNVVISGAPGTAKSTLAGLFAAAACARAERTLYISFDEGAAQIVRNLSSVGIRLAPFLASGVLRMYSTRTRGPNVEDQFGTLRGKVREHNPSCLVIDPLSALSTKLTHAASADAAQQFLDFLKEEEITVVHTSMMHGLGADETGAAGIAVTADTWIHVSHVIQDGERKRALTIIKSRGSDHSNQVRELTLSSDGISLTETFAAQGNVLMGVACQNADCGARSLSYRAHIVTEIGRLQREFTRAEAGARLRVLQTADPERG